MSSKSVTVELPETLYLRLEQTAQATRQPFEAILLRAVQVGSPPDWESAPSEFQADLAAMDRLDDGTLWQVARSRISEAEMDAYQLLLDKNASGTLSAEEAALLTQCRTDLDRQMLSKAHAASLLRWRGYQIPPADKL